MRAEKAEERREVKRTNKVRIIKFISERRAVSKNEIAASLGLSMPTTLQNVKELTEEGYVVESGEYESTGGRKAKVLSIAEDIAYAAGMDISVNHITFVLVNMCREIVRKARIRLPFSKDYSYYESMGNWLQVFLEQTGVDKRRIAGVGISVPGTVNREEKLLLRSRILQAENISFKRFEELVGYPCQVETEAGAAAYAELAGESGDFVYLSLSDTVEGAIYMNHDRYPGKSFKSASFGHMKIEKNGRPCYCGSRGCLDSYCSRRALQGEDESLDVFFEKLRARETGYRQRIEEYLDHLAIAIANLRMVFDCQIILGGQTAGYLGEFRKELDRKVVEYDRLDPDTSFLKIGKCQTETPAWGAAMGFVDRFFEEL